MPRGNAQHFAQSGARAAPDRDMDVAGVACTKAHCAYARGNRNGTCLAASPLSLEVLMRTAIPLIVTLVGCSSMGAGDLGVTPGGSQDIGYARTIIANGGIPGEGTFTAEGLFSEHDLPFEEGSICDAVLCPAAAVATATMVDDGSLDAIVQIGFDTNLDSDSFERLPQDLALAVDVSGSMASDDKMESVKLALEKLVAQLDADDRMALVAFDNSADLRVPSIAMDAAGQTRMLDAIRALGPQGGTNIEDGLSEAYAIVSPRASEDGVGHRIMLFTDAQPNIGATDIASFLGMARVYGEAGIGLSVFGVGLDMGAELANEVSKTRGGNSFYLATAEDIEQIFDDELAYIVSPLGYDLEVRVDPAAGIDLVAAYGAPTDELGKSIEFGASTLFLSKRNGGIAARFAAKDGIEAGHRVATFGLSYTDPEGEPVDEVIDVLWNGGEILGSSVTTADALGVYKLAALTNEFLALDAGALFCNGTIDQKTAAVRIDAARAHLVDVDAAITDDSILTEVELMSKLEENMSGGAKSCWSSYY
jgi:Ca-activated chloride channel family protein